MKWFVFIVLFPLSLFGELSWRDNTPQGVSVEVVVPQEQITPGSTATVQVVLQYPESYHVNLDDLKSHLLQHSVLQAAPFTLVSANTKQEKLPDGKVQQNFTFVLQPQFSGHFPLSFRTISFLSDSEKQIDVVTDVLFIDVQPFHIGTAAETEIGPLMALLPWIPIEISHENRKLAYEPAATIAQRDQKVFQQKAFPWLEIALGLLATFFLWWAFTKHEQPKPPLTAEQRAKKAQQRALQTIDQLQSKEGNREKFYVDLSQVVRSFVEEKYQLHATSQTTPEFLEEIKQSLLFSQDEKQTFERFMLKADSVKFALHQPTEQECEESLHAARDVVLSS